MLASQDFSNSLRPAESADTWEVQGRGGVLPMNIPLNSSWAALRSAYGPTMGRKIGGVVVMFCKYPNMLFYLDADPDLVGPLVDNDLTRIPSDSKVARIIITRSVSGGAAPAINSPEHECKLPEPS